MFIVLEFVSWVKCTKIELNWNNFKQKTVLVDFVAIDLITTLYKMKKSMHNWKLMKCKILSSWKSLDILNDRSRKKNTQTRNAEIKIIY